MNQNAVFNKVLQVLAKLPSAADFDKMKEEANRFKTLSARCKQALAEKLNSLRHDMTKLLGYGIDYLNQDDTLKLTSIYSSTPDQYLVFKVKFYLLETT